MLTACQQSHQQQENSPAVNIPVYEFNGISASARLTGRLTLKNGCLYADDSLLIFPENQVKWDELSQTLTYKGRSYQVGQQVDFSGGNGDFKQNSDRIKHLNQQCIEKYVWFVG